MLYNGICLKRTLLLRKNLSALKRFFYENLTVNHAFRSRLCVHCPLYTMSALDRFLCTISQNNKLVFFRTSIITHLVPETDLLKRCDPNSVMYFFCPSLLTSSERKESAVKLRRKVYNFFQLHISRRLLFQVIKYYIVFFHDCTVRGTPDF